VPAVEEEAAVGIDVEVAHAERLRDFIQRSAPVAQPGDDAIQVWIAAAVPAMRVWQADRERRLGVGTRRDLQRALATRCKRTVRIADLDVERRLAHPRVVVAYAREHVDVRGVTLDPLHRRVDAGAAVVEQVEMQRRDADQRHAAIEPAMDEEIARQRDHALRRTAGRGLAVVGAHDDLVDGVGVQRVGDVQAETREGAGVAADVHAVHPHVGNVADAVELQVMPRTGSNAHRLQAQAVPTLALRIVDIRRARQPVFAQMVPGVRQRDLGPVAIIQRRAGHARGIDRRPRVVEAPAVAQRDDRTGVLRVPWRRRGDEQQQGQQTLLHKRRQPMPYVRKCTLPNADPAFPQMAA